MEVGVGSVQLVCATEDVERVVRCCFIIILHYETHIEKLLHYMLGCATDLLNVHYV